MTTSTRKRTHPGKFVEHMYVHSLENPFGHTVEELAAKMNIQPTQLALFIAGGTRLSISLARRLADCTGASLSFWFGLQRDYDIWQAEQIEFPTPIEKLHPHD